MISSTFDRSCNYKAVVYARMSSDRQNERSPEQQIDQIHSSLSRNGLTWQLGRSYVDRGISGRTERDRPAYQEMMRDIRSGKEQVNLILIDSMSRFGRHDRVSIIRNELKNRYGVLILTADSNFEDPTTESGRYAATFREMTAHSENRNKARDVSRGKADAVKRGFWPGGPIPFGYQPHSEEGFSNGRRRGAMVKLVLDTSRAHVIRLLFDRAKETGAGAPALTRYLNEHTDISSTLKPFHSATIDNWLSNRLYTGAYVYNKFRVDVVDDVRVRERNEEAELIIQEDFCEAIVGKELFCAVQVVRERRKRPGFSACANDDRRLLRAQLPPTSVTYCLAGLVRCDHCDACMTPTSHREEGRNRRAYYRCPRHIDGVCNNSRHVPIDWLEGIVMRRLGQSLFADTAFAAVKSSENSTLEMQSDANELTIAHARIDTLIEEVRHELELRQQPSSSPIPQLREEILILEERRNGWMLCVGSTQISSEVRHTLLSNMRDAENRLQILRHRIQELESVSQTIKIACDRDMVMSRLTRLTEIIRNGNPSRLNLELSLHIDCIRCSADGKVMLRTCQLGAFSEALDVLRTENSSEEESLSIDTECRVRPRRRAPLRLYGETDYDDVLRDIAAFAADPQRFSGINEQWFNEETFSIPAPMGWAEKNCQIVAKKRKEGLTEQAIADELKVSVPTVRKAIKIAQERDPDLASLPRKMPRPRWHETHADEVFRRKQAGESQESIALHFKKCEETVRKAIVIGRKRAQELNSDE